MDKRLYERLRSGHLENVRFAEFTRLVEDFGFTLADIEGSHHTYNLPNGYKLSVQPDRRRQAKAYQISQFLRAVERYKLEPKG